MGFVCDEHRSKPDPQYFDKPFDWFHNKYCKLSFQGKNPDGEDCHEAMWVLVTGDQEIEGTKMLIGVLDNDPVYEMEYKCGDGVGFERNEICAVAEGS